MSTITDLSEGICLQTTDSFVVMNLRSIYLTVHLWEREGTASEKRLRLIVLSTL